MSISTENLSKKYTICHNQGPYKTLVETLTRQFKNLYRKLPSTIYEDFWAVKDVNIEINEGDRVGVIGRNGSGKSTLLKLLSRITDPTTGKIKIKGRVASLLEVGTGFHPELTGRENIFLNGAILGMTQNEIRRKFDEIVAFSEIEKFLDTPIKRYSSGMYTRLGFSIAAHLDPDILILDEVLAVGDAQFQQKCLAKLNVLGAKGRTILFVSHDINAVLSICNKGILMDKGRLIMQGDTQTCIDAYIQATGQYQTAWKGFEGNHDVRLTYAELSKPSSAKEFFLQGEQAHLDIDYEILTTTQDVALGISLTNPRHQVLGRSHSVDDHQAASLFGQPGKHNARFTIDTSYLHEGDYFLKFDFLHNRNRINSSDIILRFSVLNPHKPLEWESLIARDGLFLGKKWQLK